MANIQMSTGSKEMLCGFHYSAKGMWSLLDLKAPNIALILGSHQNYLDAPAADFGTHSEGEDCGNPEGPVPGGRAEHCQGKFVQRQGMAAGLQGMERDWWAGCRCCADQQGSQILGCVDCSCSELDQLHKWVLVLEDSKSLERRLVEQDLFNNDR